MAVFTAAATLGASILGASVGTGLTFAFQAAIGFLAQAALGFALNALTPKPKTQGANRGYQVNTKGSALDHQIIYGRARTGGVIIYDETGEIGDDEPDERLFRVIAFAGHEIDSYDEFYVDGTQVFFDDFLDDAKPILGNRWRKDGGTLGRIRLDDRALGTDDQTAFPRLVSSQSGWTSQHRLRGIAAVYLEFLFQPDVFPTGVPEFTATVKGKKVYDPREPTHDVNDSSTWEWSDNPALCIADYLRSGYGLGENPSNIDYDLVATAANVCDEITSDGSKRYTCNGAFTTSVTPYDILNDLLTSMGGLLWYAQGQWRMKAATYVAPTITFDEDDIRSSIAVKTRHSRRDNFNTVRGTFRGEESDWQVTDYPEVSNSAFLSADGGQESVLDLDLPFTDNSAEARRIARIALERNRQQLTVSASFGLRAFQVQVGDIIKLSLERFGWVEKEFEVNSWTFGLTEGQDIQVQMSLREISASVFDEVNDGVIYERDNTNLPEPTFVPNIGISAFGSTTVLYETLRNVLNIVVTASNSVRVDSVETQYRPTGTVEWIPAGRGNLGEYQVIDLLTGNYDVRARAINSLGVRGEWETLIGIPAEGLLQPPADVQGFTSEINGATLQLEWDAIPDLDLSYYRVRYTPDTSVIASWANSINYAEKVPRPATSVAVPARAGTFLIKGVDKSGVESTNAVSLVVDPDNLESFANTLTQTEDPTFSGVKTDLVVEDNTLRIADVILFDDLSGNIDSLSGQWDDLGVAVAVNGSGVYEFSDYIDTSSINRCRVRVDATTLRFNGVGNAFDDISGKIDTITGLWDDLTDEANFADTNVKAFVSTTNDDPSGTPEWSSYTPIRVTDISARAFRFKIEFQTDSVGITPSVTELDAVVQYN